MQLLYIKSLNSIELDLLYDLDIDHKIQVRILASTFKCDEFLFVAFKTYFNRLKIENAPKSRENGCNCDRVQVNRNE